MPIVPLFESHRQCITSEAGTGSQAPRSFQNL